MKIILTAQISEINESKFSAVNVTFVFTPFTGGFCVSA